MNRNSHRLLWGLLAFVLFCPVVLFSQVVSFDSKNGDIEDFESGDFSNFNWQFSGNLPWTISSVNPYEGIYSARSGLITHSQQTSLVLQYDVYVQDTLSFWLRVSSESGFDFLRFFHNGVQKGQWSGTVPWQKASYVIPAGINNFEWRYIKDGSLNSGEDAAWIDFIKFPPTQLQALFITDTTVVCTGDSIYFYDQSVGPVNQWFWGFMGANPATSTLQNPVIVYPDPGVFNIFLEVSDGVETASIFLTDFLTVMTTSQSAVIPSGMTYLCATWGNTSYTTSSLGGNVTSYHWLLIPEEAGTINSTGSTSATVVWNQTFTGVAQLRVAGVNYCGIGIYSNPLNITRYLPALTLTLPDYVSIKTPPFELTGGSPSGGTYSGPGVFDGFFDPEVAGLGEHAITYSYTDLNSCSNVATTIITVTETTGLYSPSFSDGLMIFPNPNTGRFTLTMKPIANEMIDIKILNPLGRPVYSEDGINMSGGVEMSFDFEHLNKGLYYIFISGKTIETVRKIVIH